MKILDACCGSKWNEEQITLPMVKGLLPSEPILGQRRCKTVWLVFFKEKEK
jgi:hypothetical protein